MKLLFDQGVPVPLAQELPGHEIATAWRLGWSNLNNGALLAAAEQAGLDAFVTTDRNLRYQQNLAGRRLAIVVLPTTRWAEIRLHAAKIRAIFSVLKPGDYVEVGW